MSSILPWVKQHKAATILIAIFIFWVWNFFSSQFLGFSGMRVPGRMIENPTTGGYGGGERFNTPLPNAMRIAPPVGGGIGGGGIPDYNSLPPSESKNRMVVQESSMSLVVKNVAESLSAMKKYTESIGGFMVNSNLSNPQEAASGDLVIRVPSIKLEEALAFYRSQSMKVVSENLQGTDVTDQYEDLNERLRILEGNKRRMEELMNKATEISDITNIQQQVFNLQSQIDGIKGQQKYLEQTSKLARITIYLSTDEFSLPYNPSQPFRPDVVFKTAVRSLVGNLQSLASTIIWFIVYSVIWGPILIGIILYRRKHASSLPPQPN